MFYNIEFENRLLAQVYDMNHVETVEFPTPTNENFQFGFGYIVNEKVFTPHIHKSVKRELDKTSEFLYVVSGEIQIAIYDENAKFVQDIVLTSNMGLLQFIGGHRIVMKSNTKYFELKQGPYLGHDIDKIEMKEII